MKLKWQRLRPGYYVASGNGTTYQVERMLLDDTTRIVWVVTVDHSCPEPFKNLKLAKASAQAFEDGAFPP